jgi:mRNA interferase YafQ
MRTSRISKAFKKDYDRAKKRGWDLPALKAVIARLLREETLDPKHRDHALIGQYVGCRECHLGPDRLLIYGVQSPG